MIRKCQAGATDKETINAPTAAPPNPARLHTAWNRAMIDRSYKACTPIDCAFAEIFIRLREQPKHSNAITNCQPFVAKPMTQSITLNARAPNSMIRRLSLRLRRTPVRGKVPIRPIGSAKRMAPNCASFKCNSCCMVGMREAQVLKPKPETKKKMVTMMRVLLGDDKFSAFAAIDDCTILI